MSDPAFEAAKRAEQESGWWKSGYSTPWDHDYAVDAIREALKPLRELHRQDGDYCWSCDHTSWPCPTAKLIYSTQELGEGKP